MAWRSWLLGLQRVGVGADHEGGGVVGGGLQNGGVAPSRVDVRERAGLEPLHGDLVVGEDMGGLDADHVGGERAPVSANAAGGEGRHDECAAIPEADDRLVVALALDVVQAAAHVLGRQGCLDLLGEELVALRPQYCRYGPRSLDVGELNWGGDLLVAHAVTALACAAISSDSASHAAGGDGTQAGSASTSR